MSEMSTARQELAAAKARLTDASRRLDPLAPLRAHPYLTAAGACAVGALLANDSNAIASALAVARTIGPLLVGAQAEHSRKAEPPKPA
jgi:hypothetical protein